MDLALSDEERMVGETARAVAEDLHATRASAEQAWSSLMQAGLCDLRLSPPEECFSTTAARLVVESLGRRLCPAPYLGHLLGSELLQFAVGRNDLGAAAAGRPLTIGLKASLREIGAVAEPMIGPDGSPDGLVVALDGMAPVLLRSRVAPRGMDPGRTIVHGGERIAGYGPLSAHDQIRWEAFALAMVAADLVGVMEGALDLALSHARGRIQFGKPIGAYQAIKHILAEQAALCAGARAACSYAAWAVDELDAGEALLAARVAKARAAESGRIVTEAALQVHGGMGFTWEVDAHRYLKRAALDRCLLGDEIFQYRRIAVSRSGH